MGKQPVRRNFGELLAQSFEFHLGRAQQLTVIQVQSHSIASAGGKDLAIDAATAGHEKCSGQAQKEKNSLVANTEHRELAHVFGALEKIWSDRGA